MMGRRVPEGHPIGALGTEGARAGDRRGADRALDEGHPRVADAPGRERGEAPPRGGTQLQPNRSAGGVGAPARRSGGRGGENLPGGRRDPRWWPALASARHSASTRRRRRRTFDEEVGPRTTVESWPSRVGYFLAVKGIPRAVSPRRPLRAPSPPRHPEALPLLAPAGSLRRPGPQPVSSLTAPGIDGIGRSVHRCTLLPAPGSRTPAGSCASVGCQDS
jgi:hypothetical protein